MFDQLFVHFPYQILDPHTLKYIFMIVIDPHREQRQQQQPDRHLRLPSVHAPMGHDNPFIHHSDMLYIYIYLFIRVGDERIIMAHGCVDRGSRK